MVLRRRQQRAAVAVAAIKMAPPVMALGRQAAQALAARRVAPAILEAMGPGIPAAVAATYQPAATRPAAMAAVRVRSSTVRMVLVEAGVEEGSLRVSVAARRRPAAMAES